MCLVHELLHVVHPVDVLTLLLVVDEVAEELPHLGTDATLLKVRLEVFLQGWRQECGDSTSPNEDEEQWLTLRGVLGSGMVPCVVNPPSGVLPSNCQAEGLGFA